MGSALSKFDFPGVAPPDGVHVTTVVTQVFVVERYKNGQRIAGNVTLERDVADKLKAFYETLDGAPGNRIGPVGEIGDGAVGEVDKVGDVVATEQDGVRG